MTRDRSGFTLRADLRQRATSLGVGARTAETVTQETAQRAHTHAPLAHLLENHDLSTWFYGKYLKT
jgi:hypothetical protein